MMLLFSNYRYPKVPQQPNGHDCGLFAIMFAEAVANGKSVWTVPNDLDGMRLAVLERIVDVGGL